MRALGSRYVYLRNNRSKMECLVSELFEKGRRQDISNDDMSKVLKLASIKLFYLEIKVIDIKDINTHSLRAGGGGGTFDRIQRQRNTKMG